MSVVNLEVVYTACKNAYTRLHNDESACDPIDGFKEIKYEFDEKTHHGAVSYYNDNTKELIVAHRGSVTLKDWLDTDVRIALRAKQTPADLAAIDYTHRLINELRQKRQPISKIYLVGHSKAGHEAQVGAVNLIKGIPYTCITLNAPGINPKIKNPDVEYNHINIRVTTKLRGDIVSLAGGKPLGHTLNLQLGEGLFACHTMDSVKKAMEKHKDLAQMPVDELIKATRVNMNLNVKQPETPKKEMDYTKNTHNMSNLTVNKTEPNEHEVTAPRNKGRFKF
ncbi:hypothetical protein L292_2101 [Acinetobacter junii CIP 107470 = MTCC 11364]|uniref:Fungal lipase-like domain-containing protein n=1 Tax=Acinetobacter junii CIP 107470 = MTCC 11364 TaxID=1217666 RepID=S7WXV9_ACIJU|nr:Mbeg1-like protein [Acinetobacter junii]ENV52091.1 hypothetical protein F953_00503 [Acinetobacter junii CIP 107470 = MTCC 11364]EPR86867.1 hypothetical protein L292_2101 [Acinetobacter junii CIP 107470 = MTCC 11364]